MEPAVLHLHTYFLFPFSIDKEAVLEAHPKVWAGRSHWIDGLDKWIASYAAPLAPWRRSSYAKFDMASPAYQDMVFFHPFVRRIFFDTAGSPASRAGGNATAAKEALLRCYTMPLPAGARLWFEARDAKDRSATAEVTDLRLFLFANGIGILSIGVEARDVPVRQALWINESFRKVYPSSDRQIREARTPNRTALVLEQDGESRVVAEEQFARAEMIGCQPPLTRTITSLIYFADYAAQEFEPVLDERMIVYSYVALDPATLPPDYKESGACQVLLSRLLYVDQEGSGYRYNPAFLQAQMERQFYRRWAHQGTYYGFTSYSNVTATIGTANCDDHVVQEGFLIHRMFDTRYYLMALVALFYRATLLDFSERTALISKRLYLDQEDGRLTPENVRLANDLSVQFLYFMNYWHFAELANKDEEQEHFELQCREYRIDAMKAEIENEVESLNASLQSHYQFRNTEAVNRLAMLSLILGAGAVLTGFFGMNFGRAFARLFFEPDAAFPVMHYVALTLVTLLGFGAIAFGIYVVVSNWLDYGPILAPRRRTDTGGSLRRD
jgi:hypothetical protein